MAEGLTPLEYMLEVMRAPAPDVDDARILQSHVAMCFEAAKAAAPYIHPRLAAVEHTGKDGESLAPPVLNVVIGGSEDTNASP